MEILVRISYFVIPIISLSIASINHFFTSYGMVWYKTITLPSFTPPRWVIEIMWQLIYVLTTIAVVIVWNRFKRNIRFWLIMILFVINAFLNAYWQDRTGDAFQPVDDVQNHIRLVKVSLLRAANVFPWKSLCLSRSIAAFVMLRRRGVAVVMVAGARLENSSLLAHAWIRAGHGIIDEKPQNSTFTALVQIGHGPVDAP